MLNDSKRNFAYKKAISNRINEGHKTILDIGCGSLILRSIDINNFIFILISKLNLIKYYYSLYAAEYAVDKIYACDYSQIMSKIASEVLVRNNMNCLIEIFNMNSKDLCIPDSIDKR